MTDKPSILKQHWDAKVKAVAGAVAVTLIPVVSISQAYMNYVRGLTDTPDYTNPWAIGVTIGLMALFGLASRDEFKKARKIREENPEVFAKPSNDGPA